MDQNAYVALDSPGPVARTRVRVLACAILLGLTAGCLGLLDEDEPASPSATPNGTDPAPELAPPQVGEGTVRMDVRIPVLLIGFPEGTAERLDERLDPLDVHQASGQDAGLDDLREEPDPDRLRYGVRSADPLAPTARYDVQAASEALTSRLEDRLANLEDPGNARAVERFLADTLADHGVDVDPNRPLLVFLDSGGIENAPEAWSYEFPLGAREDVSVFGEREPILVVDTGHLGVEPRSEDGLEQLATLARNATRFRLLQGNLYELPTAPCHALTLVTAYRPTLLGPAGDGSPEELYEAARVERAFDNLTSETVHVDVVTARLPADDPALDALSRGERTTEEALKAWLVENWRDYWVPHEGCEPYLSVLVHSEDSTPCARPYPSSTDPPGLHPHGCARTGFAHYTQDGSRLALSWINEATVPGDDEPGDLADVVDYLHAHEAGHLFGLHHPHGIYEASGSLARDATFTSIWSTMSYATGDLLVDFGTVDRANLERNTAARTLVAAHDQGQADTEAYQRALDHLARYEWTQARQELAPLVDPGQAG